MASLTIRKLDDEVKEALRVRAARAGRSMEEEARLILVRAVRGMDGPALLERAKALFGPAEGVVLEVPPRDGGREVPDFDP
jgi:plasmid stability protein